MKIVKKCLILLSALFILFCFAGCNNNKANTNEPTTHVPTTMGNTMENTTHNGGTMEHSTNAGGTTAP